jgi:protein-L-isoaspartate(D-aspartate) O-methyltransferase
MDPETARERLVEQLVRRGHVEDPRTADALRSVPRHEFLPSTSIRRAYADRPLPIDAGQTVSAPHMVAQMSDLLELSPGDRVLEIGTGCGYHAAVTCEIVGDGNVYSVEYHEALADRASRRLDELGYDVHVRHGDGHDGWPEHAPYDAAYLTCAAPSVPDTVIEQVETDGRIVGPVGRRRQQLVRLRVTRSGIERETHGGVRFVSMLGEE